MIRGIGFEQLKHICQAEFPRSGKPIPSLGAGNLVYTNFHLGGRAEIHFCLIDTAEMYLPPLLLHWQRIFCYENRTDAYRALATWCDRRCLSGSTRKEPYCIHALLSVPKSGNQLEALVQCVI
jgi:hypothetical protein